MSEPVDLVEEGLREAAAIPHPLVRARHRAAWVFRLSAADPERAAGMAEELSGDPDHQVRFLLTVLRDRLAQGGTALEPQLSQVLAAAESADPQTRLEAVNTLSELAVDLGEKDRDAALAALDRLLPAARAISVEGTDLQQPRVLGAALVGEALALLGAPTGAEVLDAVEEESRALPAHGALLRFLANARVEPDPLRALATADALPDPAERLDALTEIVARLKEDDARAEAVRRARALLAETDEDPRRVERIARLGQALSVAEPVESRRFLEKALALAREQGGQLYCLHATAIGAALAEQHRDRAGEVFRQAAEAAMAEEEPIRRITCLVVVANEMAISHPREAADLFHLAMDAASQLEAMWELAHLFDVVFQQGRSPYLDLAPVVPVLEAALARLQDEDPRIPGVFGLPEVARYFLQADRDRAVPVFRRWLAVAEASADPDGMTQAAAGLFQADSDAGREALRHVRDYLYRHVDCPSMGEYARTAAPLAPELVLDLAPRIPDRRERADALTAAAVHLYPEEPERALRIIRSLERPVDRSSALLALVDRQLGTGDRPEPQPLLEELP